MCSNKECEYIWITDENIHAVILINKEGESNLIFEVIRFSGEFGHAEAPQIIKSRSFFPFSVFSTENGGTVHSGHPLEKCKGYLTSLSLPGSIVYHIHINCHPLD